MEKSARDPADIYRYGVSRSNFRRTRVSVNHCSRTALSLIGYLELGWTMTSVIFHVSAQGLERGKWTMIVIAAIAATDRPIQVALPTTR